jgi:hypothetical protein
MSTIMRYGVITAAGLIVGMVLGLGLGHRFYVGRIELSSDILALAEYETLAGLQYKEADTLHGKQALADLLRFMDEMDQGNKHVIQREMDLDRGIAYMRLALLAERTGNDSEYKSYSAKAQESLRKRDGQDISEDRLRQLVAKFDSTPTYELPGVFLLTRGTRK